MAETLQYPAAPPARSTYRGMPYGGMPADALLSKLEVTLPPDADSITQVGRMAGHSGYDHKDYIMGAMLDRRPDPGWLESDQARRDGRQAREVLNLRFGGSRGTREAPSHPEMFIGFTGDDPRGSQNIPRFDELRRHTEARFAQHMPTMGNNVGHDGFSGEDGVEAPHQIAERPWVGPELEKARRKGVQDGLRRRTKIFTTSKVTDAPAGRNVVAPERGAAGRERQAAMKEAKESWTPHRLQGGGNGLGGQVHRRDALAGPGVSLWRHTAQTADLPAARYGHVRGGKFLHTHTGEAVAAARSADTHDQDYGASRSAPSRQGMLVLARAMAGEAASRRAAAGRNKESMDADLATAATSAARTAGAHTGQAGVARAYLAIAKAGAQHDHGVSLDSAPRRSDGAAHGAAAAGRRQMVGRKGLATHARSELAVGMAEAAARKSDPSAAADVLRAAYNAVAAGYRAPEMKENYARTGRSAAASESAAGVGTGARAAMRDATAHLAAVLPGAAEGLHIANYRGVQTVGTLNLGTLAAKASGELVRAGAAGLIAGQQRGKAPEFVGQTQIAGQVDFDHERGLEVNDEAAGGGMAMGTKRVRSDRLGGLDADSLGSGVHDESRLADMI